MNKYKKPVFEIYHHGFFLTECKSARAAFEKAQQYREWFSVVEVRKVS